MEPVPVSRLPSLNALRCFEAAARSGSFSKAAEELNVTQSAVSHQVRQLEQWFGLSLFDRLGRNTHIDMRIAVIPQRWPARRGNMRRF